MMIQNQNNQPANTIKKRKFGISAILKIILALLVIYFAGRQLYLNWPEVTQYDWDFNIVYLALAIIFHVITLVLHVKAWCLILTSLGHNVSMTQGFRISYIANLGRYIPGKFWQVFGMIYLLNKINVDKKTAVASWVFSYIYGILSAFLVGIIAMSMNQDILSDVLEKYLGININISLLLLLIAPVSLIVILAPKIVVRFYNYIMDKMKRSKSKFSFNYRTAFQIYFTYFIAWIFYGAGFYFLTKGLLVENPLPLILAIGSMVLAYILGLLAFFSPGGIGVREIILQSLLISFLGPIASGIVIAARAWSLIVEFIATGIALLIRGENKGSQKI